MAKNKKIITYKRILDKAYLKAADQGEINLLINNRPYFYSFAGRIGLLSIIENLNIEKDEAVLLPSFLPEGILLPFKKKKKKIIFYKLTNDLMPDITELRKLKEQYSIKAILLIHYFGKELDISKYRNVFINTNTIIIEDCAHLFFSSSKYNNSFVGVQGDISLFSLTKFLPIPDGSLFVFNNKELFKNYNLNLKPLSPLMWLSLMFHRFSLYLKKIHVYYYNSLIINFFSKLLYLLYYKIICWADKPYKMSKYSFKILYQYSLNKTVDRRKRNVFTLGNQLSSQHVKITEDVKNKNLPGYPILPHYNSNFLVSKLKEQGIEALQYKSRWYFYGELLNKGSHTGNFIIDNHILLPINENLNNGDIKRIITVLDKLNI